MVKSLWRSTGPWPSCVGCEPFLREMEGLGQAGQNVGKEPIREAARDKCGQGWRCIGGTFLVLWETRLRGLGAQGR